jgi:hypothetical protein
LLADFEQLNARVYFISADPPEASRKFRERLELTLTLVSDEKHVIADHFGVPISYRGRRAQTYPYGFNQPAIFAFRGDESVFAWVQRPRWWNFGGSTGRPKTQSVLSALSGA